MFEYMGLFQGRDHVYIDANDRELKNSVSRIKDSCLFGTYSKNGRVFAWSYLAPKNSRKILFKNLNLRMPRKSEKKIKNGKLLGSKYKSNIIANNHVSQGVLIHK